MLKVEQLKVHALPPLSFAVPAGECLAIEGPSGSGKSLLLRAIADLDPADGHVFLDGAERSEMTAPQWRGKVRYAAAEPGWWGETAGDHFVDPAKTMGLMPSLELAPKLMDQTIASLSTGERQRLALLRALQDNPTVILFDEPTSALDEVSARLVEGLIHAQIVASRHVLLVSHDKALLQRLAHAHLLLGDAGKGEKAGASERSGASASVVSLKYL